MVFDRAMIDNINEKYCKAEISYRYFNRTVKTLNINFTILVELTEKSIASLEFYKFSNNVYKLTSIQSSISIKQGLKMATFDIRQLVDLITPPCNWPLKPNVR